MSKGSKVNQVVLIIIDDVRSSHLFGLMDKGKLPTIKSLVLNGVFSKNCITSFPSITFPCYANIVLGSYSGYYPKEGSAIPMYHWVGRTDPPTEDGPLPIIREYNGIQAFEIPNDIGPNAKTIFEQAGDGNFLSVLNMVNRGSYFYPDSMLKIGIAYLWYAMIKKDIASSNPRILKYVENVFRKTKKRKKYFGNTEVPRVTVAYIPGTDDLMHHKGFDHPEYINEVINCDGYVGDLINTLKETGHYDDTAICIAFDHGNYKSGRMVDLEPFFEKKGLIPYAPKQGIIGDFDATFGGIGFFNFRGESWYKHPTYKELSDFKPSGVGASNLSLFETLWEIPGVKYMYYPDENNSPDKGIIHLEKLNEESGKKIQGRIEFEGHGINQKTKYTFEDEELFGYDKDETAQKVLDNKPHSIDEWLAATSKVDFPIFIDQLPRYFKNPRSCDIMVSTCGTVGFGYEHGRTKSTYPHSHDLALRKSMNVALIIGGSPEIPSLEIDYCKTTDIVPTLLDLLGETPHKSVVGKSLLNY